MGYLWIPIYIYLYIYIYICIPIYIHTYWIPQFITFFIISFSMSSKISKLLSPQEWICSNKASPRTPVRNGAGFCIMKKGGSTVSNKSCGYSKSWLVSWKIPKNKWMIFGKMVNGCEWWASYWTPNSQDHDDHISYFEEFWIFKLPGFQPMNQWR